jgi:hypothetical protein
MITIYKQKCSVGYSHKIYHGIVEQNSLSLCIFMLPTLLFNYQKWLILFDKYVQCLVAHICMNRCFFTINVSNRCNFVFCLYFIYLLSPYMFRAFIGPSSAVSWAVVLCYHLVRAVLVDCLCALRTGSWRWPCCTQFARHTDSQQTLHKPNGSIKQQLKIPAIMGLWRPETCRVREDIWNKDKKQSRICWKHLL